jgi:SAM-dependent methyltransferase
VATYRAERYRGFSRIADLGCSIGSDTLALSQIAPTIGLDRDPLRLVMAQANARSLGSPAEFLHADLTSRLPFSSTPQLALFFDPSRRETGRRLFSVQQYHPPLEIIRDWLPHYPALGVKVSPGVHLNELRSYDCEVEFISLRGELKEAALWFGPLKTVKRRATVLPGPHTLTPEVPEPTLPIDEPRGFLYEPDPAVIRAGLVRTLGARLNAAQLDPKIAYLTSDQKIEIPFARLWEVEDWMPFGLKKLRHYLRERNIGQVVVKKRGSAIQPEFLIRKLKLQGDHTRVLFLTQLRGRPIVVIGYKDFT